MAEAAIVGLPLDVATHLCGLCGCGVTKHTASHCRECGEDKPHEFVRADVLACTLLAKLGEGMEVVTKLLYLNNKLLERIAPDPNAPRIFKPN